MTKNGRKKVQAVCVVLGTLVYNSEIEQLLTDARRSRRRMQSAEMEDAWPATHVKRRKRSTSYGYCDREWLTEKKMKSGRNLTSADLVFSVAAEDHHANQHQWACCCCCYCCCSSGSLTVVERAAAVDEVCAYRDRAKAYAAGVWSLRALPYHPYPSVIRRLRLHRKEWWPAGQPGPM